MVTPLKYKMLAASTCPAIFAGADMSRTSSMSPTANIAAGGRGPRRVISGESAKMASQTAAAAAADQDGDQETEEHGGAAAVGRCGLSCTERSPGCATYPTRMRECAGPGMVSAAVAPAAMSSTRPYQPMSGTR